MHLIWTLNNFRNQSVQIQSAKFQVYFNLLVWAFKSGIKFTLNIHKKGYFTQERSWKVFLKREIFQNWF